MLNLFWRLIAKLVARPAISAWLIERAKCTPYVHIMSSDGATMYMGRWWLFNQYDPDTHHSRYWWCPWSIRIHHIMLADIDRDLHDHPWNARTIILRGSYTEERLLGHGDPALRGLNVPASAHITEYIDRTPGSTATLRFGEFHRIDSVSRGGVYTLFISGRYRGTWGFLVNNKKVPYREYRGKTPSC